MRWVESDKVLVPSRPANEMIHLCSCCDFPRSYLQNNLESFTFCSTEPKRKKNALYLMVSSPIISDSQLHQSIMKGKKEMSKVTCIHWIPNLKSKISDCAALSFSLHCTHRTYLRDLNYLRSAAFREQKTNC